jgi:hypothetical protein
MALVLGLLMAAASWGGVAVDRPAPDVAQSGTCNGEAEATVTVTQNDDDGPAQTSLDSAIPAECNIGVRSDGRTARYWSIDVYDASDRSKRYFCHRGTDAPSGEPACRTPQPTNPTDNSDVRASIVREDGGWRLYVRLNTRRQGHSVTVRAHYAWKGSTGPEPVDAPARIARRRVGAVQIGMTYKEARAKELIGRIRGGCPLGGRDTRSARLLAPLKGQVEFTRSSPRKIRNILVRGGARARGVGIGATIREIKKAFPKARVDHGTDETFGVTLVRIPRNGGGRLQFAVDTGTKKTISIGVPFIAFCD